MQRLSSLGSSYIEGLPTSNHQGLTTSWFFHILIYFFAETSLLPEPHHPHTTARALIPVLSLPRAPSEVFCGKNGKSWGERTGGKNAKSKDTESSLPAMASLSHHSWIN